MIYTHVRPESETDKRTELAWDVLRVALERTCQAYGDYSIVTAPITEPQRRLQRGVGEQEEKINISLLPIPAGGELRHLTPLRIPIYRGLWGYRVLLIRAGEQTRFDNIHSLADLRMMSIGQAEFWSDVSILRRAGFRIVTGRTYDGLFKMLETRRFDAFSRSVVEVLDEAKDHKDLVVERHLLLHYPMPEYFWFPNDAEGRRLADRVRVGLLSMIADGTLQQMLRQTFSEANQKLNLKQRKVIELPNPLLSSEDPVSDPALWYSPDKDDRP